jgi:hypothetical protein
LEGKKIKEAVGQHALHGLKSAAGEVAPVLFETIKRSAHDNVDQSGSGIGKRKRTSNFKQCKRQRRDIFE